MKTFKQFLDYIFEGKHDPESEEERRRLVGLISSGKVSRNKDSKDYEDRVARGILGTNSADHGEEHTREVLQNSAASNNRYIRMHAARHPELHNHPDIHKILLGDSSQVVANLAAAERKLPKRASAPVAKKPAEKASPAVPKPKVAAAPKPKAEKPSGKMEVVPGDTEEFPYASQVSHIMKGKKRLGTVVSGVRPSEMGNDEPFSHSYVTHKFPDGEEGLKQLGRHKSHQHGLLDLVNHIKGK